MVCDADALTNEKHRTINADFQTLEQSIGQLKRVVFCAG
jgi:hypothetical protein